MHKILSLTIGISLILSGGYIFFEPELTKGATDETAISLTVTGEININCSSTVALSPSIAGQSGGTATTTFGCVIETNDSSGYNLTIQKDQKLQVADAADQRFDDYATASAATDWTWDTVAAGAEEFGFCVNSAASSSDITQMWADNGTDTCDTGDATTTAWQCWHPIPTSPAVQVANRTTATPAGGVLITFGLQAQAGSSNNLEEGTYNCTTTATAVVNS